MRISTSRLTLRTVEAEDWEAIRAIWQSVQDSPCARYDRPHSTEPDVVRSQIARWAEASRGREHMFFSVCLGEQVIGYYSCNRRPDGYELGYCFHADFHGRGYGKESLAALLHHLKGLGIAQVTVGTALDNTPSVALLRTLGFRLRETESVSFYKAPDGKDITFQGGIFQLDM